MHRMRCVRVELFAFVLWLEARGQSAHVMWRAQAHQRYACSQWYRQLVLCLLLPKEQEQELLRVFVVRGRAGGLE